MRLNDKLSTQERLMKWYHDRQMKCSLCGNCPDSVKHLFFECPFSVEIWNEIKKKSQLMDMSADWEGIINRMIELPCNNSINNIVRRLVLATRMYYIWVERNKMLFAVEK